MLYCFICGRKNPKQIVISSDNTLSDFATELQKLFHSKNTSYQFTYKDEFDQTQIIYSPCLEFSDDFDSENPLDLMEIDDDDDSFLASNVLVGDLMLKDRQFMCFDREFPVYIELEKVIPF